MDSLLPDNVRRAIEADIQQRVADSKQLATRFQDLKGLSFLDFIVRLRAAGLNPQLMGFVRVTALFEALNDE